MLTSDMIRKALEEDVGAADITSEALVPENLRGRGIVLAKQDLVVAGLGVACDVFLALDPTIRIRPIVSTVSIPPPPALNQSRQRISPNGRGSILDADPPAQGVKIARRITLCARKSPNGG